MPKPKYKPSDSGFYKVTLSRVWKPRSFAYRPGADIRVDQAVLDQMLDQDELVVTVTPD